MRAQQLTVTLSQRGSVLPASVLRGIRSGLMHEPRSSYRQPELPFSHLV